MRYQLDNEGYLIEASFGCTTGMCTEYTGTIPEDYETIEEWFDGESDKLNAWKIVSGNLVFDSAKYSILQMQYEQEEQDNSYVTHKELNAIKVEQDENLKELYDEKSIENSTMVRLNTINNSANLEVEKVDIRTNGETINNNLKLFLTSGNLLPNELTTKRINGMLFEANDDRSITISGTSTANIEIDLAGSSEQVESIMYFIKNANYYLNGLTTGIELKFYDYDGTDRTLIGTYSNDNNVLFEEDKKITQITMNIATGTTINKIIYPMLQEADQVDITSGNLIPYEPYKSNTLLIDLGTSSFALGDQLIIKNKEVTLIKDRFLSVGDILYTNSDGELTLYFDFPEELYKTLPSEITTIVQFGTVNPKIYISDKKIYLYYTDETSTTKTIALYDKEKDISLTSYTMNLGSTNHITVISANSNSGGLDYISKVEFETWTTISLNYATMPTTYYKITNVYTDKNTLVGVQYRNTEKINTDKVKIGTFSIFEDKLVSDIIPSLDFTEEDMTKVRNYILNKGTLTYTEKLLYDLNDDGVVNAKDLLIMSKMIKCNVTTTEHGALEINSKDPQRTILLKDKDGNEVVNLSMLGITTPNLQVGNIDFLDHQSLLWEGGLFMQGTQTITLSEKVSEQVNGIVLVFSEYANDAAQDYNFSFHFVPKEFVSLYSGYGSSFFLNNSKLGLVGSKYLYIRDDNISGNAANIETGTGASGIKYTNNRWVLRAIIGV